MINYGLQCEYIDLRRFFTTAIELIENNHINFSNQTEVNVIIANIGIEGTKKVLRDNDRVSNQCMLE